MPAPQEAYVREQQDRDLNACEGRLSFMEGPTGVYEYARQAGYLFDPVTVTHDVTGYVASTPVWK